MFRKETKVVLESGNIIHTLLFWAASVLQGLPGVVCAEGMYIVQCLMNYLIPSASGQAAVTMPLMAPLADVVGVTRQTATICFQMGDGISKNRLNMINVCREDFRDRIMAREKGFFKEALVLF